MIKQVKLENYIKILSGFAFKSNLFTNDSSFTPLIRIRDIKRGFSETFYSGDFNKNYLVYEGDMLIGMDGEFNVENWKGIPSLLNQRVCKLEISDNNLLDKQYLFYIINGKLKEIEDKTSYVTVKHLSLKDINKIEIPLPPLSTQKAIAEKLDKADALRKKDQELLALYDELAQAIFIDMFGDPVKNEKGWEISQYGSEFKISSGGTPRTNNSNYWEGGEISWIGSNMCQNKVIYQNDGKHITEEGLKNSSARVFPVDTVLVALVGATIGKVALLKFETSTNQNIAGIEINGSFNSLFVFHSLMNSYNVFMELGNGGFKMANLSFIRNLELISPALELQNQFAEKIQNIEAQKALVKQQAQQSEDLFQALLQESFNFN